MRTSSRRRATAHAIFLALIAALLVFCSCEDIEVAANGGGDVGQDVATDGIGPLEDGVGPIGDTRPDDTGPRPDAAQPDDVGPPPPDGGEDAQDVVGPEDVPVVPDVPADATPEDVSPEDVSPADVPVDTGVDVSPPLPCVERMLDPAWGSGLVSTSTLPAADDFAGSCGGSGSKDLAFGWVVPFTDWFSIDTHGSDFDTVLYLLRGACDGPEAFCANDTSPTDDRARIVREFTEGDTYVIVLDGNSGARGEAVLDIEPVACPDGDVGDGATLPQSYSIASGPAEHNGPCGGDGPERSFRFQPPEVGLWRIQAKSDAASDLNVALYLERGPICGGEQLQCNGGTNAAPGRPVSVTRFLRAGDPVTVLVDTVSGTGTFELGVEKLAPECPAFEAQDVLETELDIRDAQDVMTSSCGPNADTSMGFSPYADILVAMNDPEPGSGASCTLAVQAGFPFSLSIVGGECSGPELSCETTDEIVTDDHYEQMYALPRRGGRLTAVISPTRPEWGGWFSSTARVGLYCIAK